MLTRVLVAQTHVQVTMVHYHPQNRMRTLNRVRQGDREEEVGSSSSTSLHPCCPDFRQVRPGAVAARLDLAHEDREARS